MLISKKSKRITQIVLALLLVIYLMPILAMLMNSFKSYREIMDSFIAFPTSFTLENYREAWSALDFTTSSFNSLLMTFITVTGLIGSTSLCAYKLARTQTKMSGFLYTFFTTPYLIPFFAYMIPVVKLGTTFHLTNNILGVSLISIGTSGSFALFMLCGSVKTIPKELDEAAMVDGCGSLKIFTKIMLPLMKPAISSVAIIYSLWTWNNFMLPFLMLTKRDKQTLIIRVYDLFGMYGTDWQIVIASLILISIPIIIIYIFFQKSIIGGMTAGAVKG